MRTGVRGWIDGDESGKEMLRRVLTDCPYLYLCPFKKFPLRVGNVVELVGPSPCAKTLILMQTAIDCILPKHYGGLGRLVMFIDLDCRFDILSLSQMLKNRIAQANEYNNNQSSNDEDLFGACMRRFLYIRCYDTLQFLATLKTLPYQLEKEKTAHGIGVSFMMIDSIGAFHWVDRASTTLHITGNNRKCLSLQNVSVTVVQEIKKLLLVNPMLVIATKATILGNTSVNESTVFSCNLLMHDNILGKDSEKGHSSDSAVSYATNNMQQLLYREFMSSAWQSFVTVRILLKATDDNKSVYTSEWLMSSLSFVDKFIVKDAGLFCVSYCVVALR